MSRSKKIVNIIGIIFAIIIVVGLIGCITISFLGESGFIKAPSPDIDTINAIDVMEKYEENSYNAEKLYNDERFRTTAVVENIGGDMNIVGGIELTMTAEKDGKTKQFYAYFKDNQRDEIAKLRVGDKLTFDGTILNGKIWKKCEIVK
jgi:hypothetical protein